jgi:hypothetical protein
MRTRLVGFATALCMLSAVGGLTATPSYATTYFVKTLHEALAATSACPPTMGGGNFGSVVYRRGPQNMFATIYLRGAAPGTYHAEIYVHHPNGTCTEFDVTPFSTNANGNATVQVQAPRAGAKSFFAFVEGISTSHSYVTVEVPNFGY